MLQIQDIRKTYITGELVQTALDGVSLNLRDNEFVAILGPSGSGKTTLLNVIGGLDRYDSGDLIINGISTKQYSDRDWDSYRNHTIGFVFQSYNLIPHQSVLANVELALTISGISKKERRRRAAKALEDVGLGNQLHKKPNQMSGGQMQRVAIARALVNDPDILLADEPTGALDSETSVQVMDLLKEVSRDRLVVMVTHNPELAEDYANRIVRVKDGKIIGDTNPYELDTAEMAAPEHKNMGKSSMSVWTALTLSFNNLRTKKARTLLTAFAGSIGIIGIALIMALSTGFQKYIDKIQADTLSNYPLTIQTETSDMGSMFAAFGASLAQARESENGTVVEQQVVAQMFAQVGTNDLASFKSHLEDHYGEIAHAINTVKYSYNIQPRIYLEDTTEGIMQANPGTLFDRIMGNSLFASYMGTDIFYEMIDNREMLESQYEVLQGRWPENYQEMIVVLSDPSQITDLMAYTLGLKDPDLLDTIMKDIMSGKTVEEVSDTEQWTYDDLLSVKLRLVDVSDLYRYNEEYSLWEDMSEDQEYMRHRIEEGEPLTIVGIVCAREGANATALSAGVAYTSDLTRHVIELAAESELVKQQLADSEIDVFSGTRFDEEKEQELDFQEMISVDSDAISSAFGMNISTEGIISMLQGYLNEVMNSTNVDTTPAQNAFKDALREMAVEMLQQYVAANAGESGKAKLYLTDIEAVVDGYLATEGAQNRMQLLSQNYPMPEGGYQEIYRPLLIGLVTTHVAEQISGQELMSLDNAASTSDTETEPTPPADGGEQTPPADGGEQTPPADGREQTPPADGGEQTPPADGGEQTPPADGGEQTPPADGGEQTPPADGGEQTPPTDGGEQTPPADGGEQTPPADGGEQTPPADGGEQTPPADGGEQTPPADGGEQTPPADGGEQNPPTDGGEQTPPADGGEQTPPADGGEQIPPTEGEPETPPAEEEPETPSGEDEEVPTEPEEPTVPDLGIDPDIFFGTISAEEVEGIVSDYMNTSVVKGAAAAMGAKMMESSIQGAIMAKVREFGGRLASYIGNSFYVDGEKIANAFQFNMTEEELQRLMMAMSGQGGERSAKANLRNLGYADLAQPTSMSIYLVDFAAKEEFIAFLDAYNEAMEAAEKEEQVIQYTDVTGMMMSSVRTIIDSVSYALIAFVAVSLVVSSIMIGIITYISVMERTKEIGILRAIGASKGNISQVFNAETFIIGLCSGLIGIGITLLLLIPGNMLIQHLTENPDIVAQLPWENAVILIGLSVILTLIGGFIPAKKAAKKDPVIALRSE